ncbi:MAG TPA: hypothetical protein VF251_07680 [Pyrinomonadaceae bacterium]
MFVSRWSILLFVIAALSLSCSKGGQPSNQPSAPPSVVTSYPPFKTREPETYQAVRSVSFTPGDTGQAVSSSITIIRDGDKRREEHNSGGKKVVYLDLPDGTYVLLPDEKIYAPAIGPAEAGSTEDGFEEAYVHTAPIQSTYQNLGSETINGTTTTKYKVTVNDTSNESVIKTETLIWIDDALGMPVKSETRSAAGIRRMELSEISLNVNKELFAIPGDYQKVEMKVLQERMR